MADRIVQAVFYNCTSRSLSGMIRLRIPSGAGGQAHAATIACNDYAWDNRFTHWAHFDDLSGPTPRWLAFKVAGRSSRAVLAQLPSAEAAEMWLIHNAK